MSEPKYKLVYFDIKGRAEPIRIMFHLAGQTFEDVRIDYKKLHEFQSGYIAPFGQLPVLEINGFKLAQSLAILRYVARQFGFHGKTPLEEAEVDSYMDLANELMERWYHVGHLKSDNEAITEYVIGEAVTKSVEIFGYFEKRLTDRDYLVGGELTVADVHLMCMLDLIIYGPGEFVSLEEFPALRAYDIRVREVPKVAEWIRNRPENLF